MHVRRLLYRTDQERSTICVRDPHTRRHHERHRSKVHTIDLGETIRTKGGVEITTYYAGHVLGAVMFHVRCVNGPRSALYTGDYNMTPDRHLGAARVIDRPPLSPDVLVTESTYAMTNHASKLRRERDFLSLVYSHVVGGGRVLIPVFSFGSVQEMSVLLDRHWERTKCDVPIYYGRGLLERAHTYYELFETWTSSSATPASSNKRTNRFAFRHIRVMSDEMMRNAGESEPGDRSAKIIFASPGMLVGGLSARIFRKWASDDRVLVILPGYCSGGTLGYQLQQAHHRYPRKSQAPMRDHDGAQRPSKRAKSNKDGFLLTPHGDGEKPLRVRCDVKSMSFASHVDSAGIVRLIRRVRPRNVVLVHGEGHRMARFRAKLGRELPGLPVFHPANGATLRMPTAEETKDVASKVIRGEVEPSTSPIFDRRVLGFRALAKRAIGIHDSGDNGENVGASSFLEGTGCAGCTW